MKIIKNP